jgi:hypothetical protein
LGQGAGWRRAEPDLEAKMHTFTIHEFLGLPKLTPGRRKKALERMRLTAARRGLNDLMAAIDVALQIEEVALALAIRWTAASEDQAMHAGGARKLDAQLDRALSGLHDSLQLMVRAFDGRQADMARTLLDSLFPKGPGAITRLPYVDQNAHVSALLTKMGEMAHHDALTALNLQDWVARIRELNERYGRALTRPERLNHEHVVAADRAGWTSMLSVVARVLGTFPSDTDVDIQGRHDLLQPLTDQQDELNLLRARRRGENLFAGEPGMETFSGEALEPEDLPLEPSVEEPIST